MVSSSAVSSDANAISNSLKKYQSLMQETTASGVWEGVSRNNALSKSEEFVSAYSGTIDSQMCSLSSALDMLIEYKELKEQYKSIETAYQSALATNDSSTESFVTKMQEIDAKMKALRIKIESLLANIISSSIESPISNFANTSALLGLTSGEKSIESGMPATGGNVSGILSVADEISKSYLNNGVKYSLSNLAWNDIDKSMSLKYTCCATFVSEILYKSGLVTKDEINSINYNLSSDMYNHFKDKWEVISSADELQAGDVVFMYDGNCNKSNGIQHVQLYAGDGIWYNAGSDNAIQSGKQSSWNSSRFYAALRPTSNKK